MLRISPNNHVDDSDYRDRLETFEVLHTPEASRTVAYWLFGISLLFFITLFLPWQQNIRAEGELTALSPQDRPQTIETTIAGRIKQWNVAEGQYVDSGAVLVVITEVKDKFFDPELLTRLKEQIHAKEENITAKENKVKALEMQLDALRTGLKFKLEQTRNKVGQAILKAQSDSIANEAAKVDLTIAKRQLKGTQSLYDSGLVALVKMEEARSKIQQAQAKALSAQNKYDVALNDLLIARLDLTTIEAEAMDKISKSQSERSATLAELYDSQGSLAKLRNEYANMSIRNDQYIIRAPQRGYIVKALKEGLGETVKEGEALLTIMPADPRPAVALYIKAMDVPLLAKGRHVRLQFDGWPALQFSGWPSVAVGTFGGKVEVIDYVDSKDGKYRVLITPDPKTLDDRWPKELRQGSGVYGWVMLDDVPVWFELWRQLNGFPPSLRTYKDGNSPADGKEAKEGAKSATNSKEEDEK